MGKANPFTLKREFKASKDKVFAAFSGAEAMGKWWEPAGTKLTVLIHNFKPGGKFYYQLDSPDQKMWGIFTYKRIEQPDIIEFTDSFADESGNICKDPFGLNLPLEILYTVVLTESDGITTLNLEGRPVNASVNQEESFQSVNGSMEAGFDGLFDKLEAYLKS